MKKMRVKKISDYPLSNIEKINIQMIGHLLTQAAVNPEYLKQISELLKRQLVAEKDTANYNTQVISNFIDKMTISLRDAGQKGINPADGFKIEEQINATLDKRDENVDLFDKNKEDSKNYDKFAFSDVLERELRTHFILKTEALDNFEKLIDELDGLMTNFMPIQDWTLLKIAIEKGNRRLSQNKLKFIEPEVFLGKESKFSESELQKMELTSPTGFLKYDLRSDGPDLLALKELVSMLKGEDLHPLTIGPGFFAKYMPEILEKQVTGLIFEVQENKLKAIKLFKECKFLENVEGDTFNNHKRIFYGPIEAATLVSRTYGVESYQKQLTPQTKANLFRRNNVDLFEGNKKYYVVVDGCVGGPKNGSPLHYSEMSKNELAIDSGEVFLFEKKEKDIFSTRIYFVPYKYDEFHPIHHHGSVIFGNNDQSYHSCITDRQNEKGDDVSGHFYYPFRENFGYYDFAQNNLIMFQPSFVAAALHYLPKGSKVFDVIYNNDNVNLFNRAARNVFEETNFIVPKIIEGGALTNFCKGSGVCDTLVSEILKNHAPLHKRWLLYQYLKDGAGLTLEKQEARYDKLAKDLENQYSFNLFITNFGGPKK